MMAIVYADAVEPTVMRLDPMNLNGQDGAWDLQWDGADEADEEMDESITFEDSDTLVAWINDVLDLARRRGIDLSKVHA